MAEESSQDIKVQQSPLQPSPELTPEQLSGKQTPHLLPDSHPLTPHPPDSKPTGRPHRLASAASKDSIPEELPISQDDDEHPPPEVDEKIEGDANQPNKKALDGLAEKARALAVARAKEKLEAPPEELEEEQPRAVKEDDDIDGSIADESLFQEPGVPAPTESDVDEGNSEDEELETTGKLSPHPPEGEPTNRPNPELKQALQGFAADVNSPEEHTDVEAQAETAARALFELLDLNSDGRISRHELKLKMAMDNEIEEILGLQDVGGRSQLMYRIWEARRQLDTDGDGYISQDELVQLLQGQAARREEAPSELPSQGQKPKQRSRSRQPRAQEQKLTSAKQSKPASRQDNNLPKIADNRLPKLVDEIEEHLKQQSAKPPLDGPSWLSELGQLELFSEELRWLINQREDNKVNSSNSGNNRGRAPRNASANSNDDLQRALQHLRSAEIEHARLQQRLHTDDPRIHQERTAELQQVEKDLLLEKRRLNQLNKESHLRDLKLARAAKRARLGELGSLDQGSGTLRVLKQTEWLQAEVDVWQVKNGLLEKQIRQQDERLKKAQEGYESLAAKRQALEDKLESDTVQNWMAEKKHQQDLLKNEGKKLRAEVQELHERRRRKAQKTKHTLRSRSRRLADLRSQQVHFETELIKLKNTELRLLKSLKQQDLRAAARAKEQKEAEEAAMLALQEAEELAAEALAAHDTMLFDDAPPLESQAGELQQVESNVFDLTVVEGVLDSAYKKAGSEAEDQQTAIDHEDDEAVRLHIRNLLMEGADDGTLLGDLFAGVLPVGVLAEGDECQRIAEAAPEVDPAEVPVDDAPAPAEALEEDAKPSPADVKLWASRLLSEAASTGDLEKALKSLPKSAPKVDPAEAPVEDVRQLTKDLLYQALGNGEVDKVLQDVFDEDKQVSVGDLTRAQASEDQDLQDEQEVQEWAATKIQAVYRGNVARADLSEER